MSLVPIIVDQSNLTNLPYPIRKCIFKLPIFASKVSVLPLEEVNYTPKETQQEKEFRFGWICASPSFNNDYQCLFCITVSFDKTYCKYYSRYSILYVRTRSKFITDYYLYTCCVSWPALGCLSSVYLHRLLGAFVSYTDILSR